MVRGICGSVRSWTRKEGVWAFPLHEQRQLVLMLKPHVWGYSLSSITPGEGWGVSQLWNLPSEILSSPSIGPSKLFCALWDELKWCIFTAFYICPSKYFPDHHRESSTNYSYKITNFMEMWLSQEFVKFLIHQTVYLKFVHLIICKLYCTKDDPPKIEYSFIHQKTKKLIDR